MRRGSGQHGTLSESGYLKLDPIYCAVLFKLWEISGHSKHRTRIDLCGRIPQWYATSSLMQMHTVRTGKRTLVYRRIQLLISGFAHIVACVSVERAITSPSLTVHVYQVTRESENRPPQDSLHQQVHFLPGLRLFA